MNRYSFFIFILLVGIPLAFVISGIFKFLDTRQDQSYQFSILMREEFPFLLDNTCYLKSDSWVREFNKLYQINCVYGNSYFDSGNCPNRNEVKKLNENYKECIDDRL